MKLVSFRYHGDTSFGALTGDGSLLVLDQGKYSLRDALGWGAERLDKAVASATHTVSVRDVDFLPPIPERDVKIICVGLNYRDHQNEASGSAFDLGSRDEHPTIFLRTADSHVGHGQDVPYPTSSKQLDYEGELAVIIGTRARSLTKADAGQVIAGYACYNDFSVRDWQLHSSQWTAGKNFCQVGAFGPFLVTADEIDDPTRLDLETRVNGDVKQHASVADMIFSIPELLEYVSVFTELNPGDVIVTGTPSGVGAFRDPPEFLRVGDTVEVEISGLGVLTNRIA